MSVYNLRKAYEFERALRSAASSVQSSKNYSSGIVTIYQEASVKDVITEGQAALRAKVSEAVELVVAANEVRSAISAANVSSGINALLTEKAALDAKRGVINAMVFGGRGTNLAVDRPNTSAIDRQLETLRERAKTMDYTVEQISVSFIDQDFVADYSSELAKIDFRLRAIADDILTANMTNTVTLSDATVGLLKKINILV